MKQSPYLVKPMYAATTIYILAFFITELISDKTFDEVSNIRLVMVWALFLVGLSAYIFSYAASILNAYRGLKDHSIHIYPSIAVFALNSGLFIYVWNN